MVMSHDRMAAMLMCGKLLQKSSSQKADDLETWLLEYYQVCSNDDRWLTLTYVTARSNLVTFVFVRENA